MKFIRILLDSIDIDASQCLIQFGQTFGQVAHCLNCFCGSAADLNIKGIYGIVSP
nr:MAG TPA: hypothetical protein [Caudoviricetes sp.]